MCEGSLRLLRFMLVSSLGLCELGLGVEGFISHARGITEARG